MELCDCHWYQHFTQLIGCRLPINFSADKHHILTSNPAKVHTFATDQANLLVCGRPISMELIHYHRIYHYKHINAFRPSPRIYNKSDFFVAKCSVKSSKKRGLVGKMMNSYTGSWEITNKAAGSSYELQHCDTGKPGKRHAAHLSPFPRELLPFLPVDGTDNHYG